MTESTAQKPAVEEQFGAGRVPRQPALAARLRGLAVVGDRMASWPAAATAAHLVTLAAAAPLLLWFNRHQWFFGDEWAFFSNRLGGGGARALFAPHNEHWSTVPILAYRALYAAFGLRSYLPYAALVVALHLCVAHLLWRVLRRTGAEPVVCVALAAIFAVLGAGSENLLWAFQIGFVGSVAMGLGHLLLVDRDGPVDRRDALAGVVAVVALAFSGITITMVAVSGLAVLLRRGWRAAAVVVAPPAAAYVVWLAWIGHEGLGSHPRTVESMLDVPNYVWTGLTAAMEGLSSLRGAGPVLVVLLAVWLIAQPRVRSARAAAPTAMACGAVFLLLVNGFGRSALGVEQATSRRYVYVCAALVLPTLARVLSDHRVRSRRLAVLAVLAFVLVGNLSQLRQLSHAEADRDQAIRRQLLAAASRTWLPAELVSLVPEPAFSPNATVDVLARLAADGAFERTEVAEEDVLGVATYLQVAPVAPPAEVPADPLPTLAGEAVPATRADGCAEVPVGADIDVPAAAVLAFRAPKANDVTVSLRSTTTPGVAGPPRTFPLPPTATLWLKVTRAGPLSVAFTQGAGQICGLQLPAPPTSGGG